MSKTPAATSRDEEYLDVLLAPIRVSHDYRPTGAVGKDNALRSTYDFAREVLGYDLAAFFERNSDELRREVRSVLTNLLTPS